MYVSKKELKSQHQNSGDKTSKPKKKTQILVGVLLCTLILGIGTAFFITRDTNELMVYDTEPDGYDYEPTETRAQRNSRINRERREFSESVTRVAILEDFDYLMTVLEANFPFSDLIYRRDGLNWQEHSNHFRTILENQDSTLNADIFFRRLNNEFFDPIQAGHLFAVDRYFFLFAINNATRNQYTSSASAYALERFISNPNTIKFYGEFDLYDLESIDEQFIHGHPNNIITNIIEDGRVASIRFHMMLDALDSDREMLREFYTEIADYEHLIIDIRGNPGGFPFGFFELVVSPHIRYPVRFSTVAFYKSGEYNIRHINVENADLDYYDESGGIVFSERPPHYRGDYFNITGSGVVGQDGTYIVYSSQHFTEQDLSIFDNYNILSIVINPSTDDSLISDFNGQIWLLIDNGVASGAEWATLLFYQSDLATVVGESGGGHFADPGLTTTFFSLPNTGIIIRYDVGYPVCRYTGRSLEEGAVPHFFNRPGLTALETALALITEGAYIEINYDLY